jgi:hypothetical protein
MARKKKEEEEKYKAIRLTFRPDIYERIMMIPKGARSKVVNRALYKGLDAALVEAIREEKEKIEIEEQNTDRVISDYQAALAAWSDPT